MPTVAMIVAGLLFSTFAVPAAAQTLVPTTPTLLGEVDAAPRPGQSGISATVGMQLQTGRTDTRGWTTDLVAAHTTERKELLRGDFTTNFGTYRQPPTTTYSRIEDNQRAKFTYIKPLPHRLSLLGLAGWRRDSILELEYRIEVEGGLGATLVGTSRGHVLAGGSFSVGNESRKYTTAGEGVRDVGVLVVGAYHVTPVFGVSGSWVMKTDVSDSGDHTSTLNTSMVAMVAKHVGMKIYFQQQYDSLHQPSVSANQSQFGAGVQVSFGAKTSNP